MDIQSNRISRLVLPLLAVIALTSFHKLKEENRSGQISSTKTICKMKNILIIGLDPKTIDFSDPDLAPGLTLEKVDAGLKAEQKKLYELGFKSDAFLIGQTETDVSQLVNHLKKSYYDGIVVGAGIRVPKNTLPIFENIINAIHENAHQSRIIFNTLPTETAEAVKGFFK